MEDVFDIIFSKLDNVEDFLNLRAVNKSAYTASYHNNFKYTYKKRRFNKQHYEILRLLGPRQLFTQLNYHDNFLIKKILDEKKKNSEIYNWFIQMFGLSFENENISSWKDIKKFYAHHKLYPNSTSEFFMYNSQEYYALKPPYTKEEIDEFERKQNIKLPEDLKGYLINVSREINVTHSITFDINKYHFTDIKIGQFKDGVSCYVCVDINNKYYGKIKFVTENNEETYFNVSFWNYIIDFINEKIIFNRYTNFYNMLSGLNVTQYS